VGFSIKAKTYTLRINSENKTQIILNGKIRYVVPIYQRPYSWKEDQVKKFISDIFISFWGHDGLGRSDNMFIGTMQLSKPTSVGVQEVIDGQQRLSTFLLLLKVLQLKFEVSLLMGFKLDWLSTEVNGGHQQLLLNEFINSIELKRDNDLNKYAVNAAMLSKEIDRIISQGTENKAVFDINQFIQHLFTRIYFVVLETEANLSKTLKIFDTINTAGLSLDEADVFKIRMFEYLTENRGFPKEIFAEVSKLYETIDSINQKEGKELINFNEVLHVYQFYLISKYGLPVELYTYSTDKFFDQLFETLFNINQWKNFANAHEVYIEIDELGSLIDVISNWKRNFATKGFKDLEHTALIHLWSRSRYSRFKVMIYLFLFMEKDNSDKNEKLSIFINKLVKLYLVYSIYFQRYVNAIYNGFNNKIMKELINESSQKAIESIEEKMGSLSNEFKDRFKILISGDITYNKKMKNLLCLLSALLEENITASSDRSILEMRAKFFNLEKPIDIEHIQSFNDENMEERKDIKDAWGSDINSIGNLVVLESSLNRSIGNREDEKLKNYIKSEFKIVSQHLVREYKKGWDLNGSQTRKRKEVSKLLQYLEMM